MAVKTYNAGVKEYRQTYWEPNYTPKDTDILACFKITPQPGIDREEVAAAVAAESSTGTWSTVWSELLTDLAGDDPERRRHAADHLARWDRDTLVGAVGPLLDAIEGEPFPIVYDEGNTIAKHYGVSSLPTLIVISKTGRIVAVRNGVTSDSALDEIIQRYL